MKTLLHICCAPCANMCVDSLRGEGIDVTGFWYNLNIHPYTEYRARRDTLKTYADAVHLPLVLDNRYALRPFIRAVSDDIANRCIHCYELRLYEAAEYAAANGFDSFSTSLLISPYQKHDLIRQVGQAAAAASGITFVYRDFRPLFRQGQRRAREMGMYMQKYCGCIFSEEERYVKRKKIIP